MGTLIRATEAVYATDTLGVRRLVAAAGDEYDPAAIPAVGILTTPDPAHAGLQPMPGYDELGELEVLEQLPGMDADQLAAVQAYERTHRARGSITRYGKTSTVVSGANEQPATLSSRQLTEGDDPVGFAYDKMTVDELQAEADRLALTVEGTGQGGNVLKSDLIAALRAHAATSE